MRVLVVEHDSLLRALVGEWLRAEGFEALFAQGGAVARIEAVDALIIDLAKPCDSHGCISAWRQAYPGARIIAVSGRFQVGDTGSQAMADKLGVTGVLAKPFTRGELRAALEA
jgi:DNA-binding response OmpR family regulator